MQGAAGGVVEIRALTRVLQCPIAQTPILFFNDGAQGHLKRFGVRGQGSKGHIHLQRDACRCAGELHRWRGDVESVVGVGRMDL